MKHKMFAIFDQAAEAFLPPWVVPTEGMALRHLTDLAEREPTHTFVRHAAQYTLFQLAEFDDSTGMLENCVPVAIRNLHILFARKPVVVDSRARDVIGAEYPNANVEKVS